MLILGYLNLRSDEDWSNSKQRLNVPFTDRSWMYSHMPLECGAK